MPILKRLAAWFDIRPGEGRTVLLACAGAFLVMAALTLGRALREGLYLNNFAVETLPYVTAAVALLGLPLAHRFSRFLSRHGIQRVLIALILIESVGLTLLWIGSGIEAWRRSAIVGLYLWTALGLLLLTSGFWVLTAERFPLRGAKRLYGLVSAGGTAGAMLAGLTLGALAESIDLRLLLPGLVVLLLIFLLLVLMQGKSSVKPSSETERRGGFREVWSNSHLKIIALLVVCATGASVLIDFQFKEAARAAHALAPDPESALTAFLGNFYGITGALALLFQLLVSGRLMARAGMGLALALLPIVLLAGSAGFALLPGLLLITLTRGADNGLRKSLFRPALEVLYVPLADGLRRRTKSVIDTTVDALAEGAGAGLIFLVVTLAGLSSRWLSIGVVLLAGAFLLLTRRMDRIYLGTVVERLREGEAGLAEIPGARQGELGLSATFTRMDLQTLLGSLGGVESLGVAAPASREPAAVTLLPLDQLRSRDDQEALLGMERLEKSEAWDVESLAQLIRLLARDRIMDAVVTRLEARAEQARSLLTAALADRNEEFIIRRRLPRVLARAGGVWADEVLLSLLSADRFEIRFRSAQALARRRRVGLEEAPGDTAARIWAALRAEVTRDRPVWELQHLLDSSDMGKESGDELVLEQAGLRGGRSLEHAFRLMSLVLDPVAVRASWLGIARGEDAYRGFAQEYLEQVLPEDIRERLWLFVGDLSDAQARASRRSLDAVVGDLMNSQATLFANAEQQELLKRLLDDQQED
jgi:hypothetical protein